METSGFPGLTKSGFHKVADGTRLYYETFGSGAQKLVLITGFHTSILTWQYQIEFFMKECPNEFEILIFDNRGYGKSDRPAELYTTTLLAQDALSLINHLKWEKYHLLGHSMGGMISQELALMDPKRLLSLTLVTTHSGGFGSFPPLGGFPKFANVILYGSISPEENASIISKLQYPEKWLNSTYEGTLVTNRSRIIPFLVKDLKWGCEDGKPSVLGLAGQLSAVTRHYVSYQRLSNLKKQLKSLNVPVLVVTGSEDNLVRTQNNFVLQKLLDATIIKIDESGHMLHIQSHGAFNKIILSHFRGELKGNNIPDSVPTTNLRSKL